MIALGGLQEIVEREGQLNHKLPFNEFYKWLSHRNRYGSRKTRLMDVLLHDTELLKRVHLELEHGIFSKDSEMGCELYASGKIIGLENKYKRAQRPKKMKGENFNKCCNGLQEAYSKLENKNTGETTYLDEKVAQMG